MMITLAFNELTQIIEILKHNYINLKKNEKKYGKYKLQMCLHLETESAK